MLPARTICPPYLFTPRRRPAESRPLRDDPPAFLWAMVLLRSSVFYRDSAANAHHFLLYLPFSSAYSSVFSAAGFFARFLTGFASAVSEAPVSAAAPASTSGVAAGSADASSATKALSAACGRSRDGLRPSVRIS